MTDEFAKYMNGKANHKNKKFVLFNSEGCVFSECVATSFQKAREHFASEYQGKLTICCENTGERKNVRL